MEIERKFLTKEIPFSLENIPAKEIAQSYLSFRPTLRIRRQDAEYIFTAKGGGMLAREEFEMPLNHEEYERLRQKTEGNEICKTRYFIPLAEGYTAELDIYHGDLAGLYTTEVEFATLAEAAQFQPPEWFGVEVTEDAAYKNTALAQYGLPKK